MPELEIDASAELEVNTNGKRPKVDAAPLTSAYTVPASYNAGATPATYCFMAFPSPPSGRIWEALRVSIGAPDPSATISGAVAWVSIYDEKPQDSSAAPPPGDLIGIPIKLDATTGSGSILDIGRHENLVRARQVIVVVLKSLPAAAVVVGTMAVVDHPYPDYLTILES